MFIAPSAYTLGGLATWLDYLIPGLKTQGWDVTLGLVSGPRHHHPETYLAVHPFEQMETIHCACSTRRGRVDAVRMAIQRIDPNLVLTVNIPDAVTAVALERMAGRNVRSVITCHGIQEDLFNDMQALQTEVDAVVCTNRLACRLASEIGQIPMDRVFHCAYGTPVPQSLPMRPHNKVFTIGYSGRLEQPQKRIHDLIEIAELLRNRHQGFRFLIAGDGPEDSAVRQAISERELSAHFEFLGFVAPEELGEKLYSASDALLVPSSWETGPIVIWEAMASGTPVVSSRYVGSGLESLLSHEDNCLMFDIGDVRAATDSLINLQNDESLFERIRTSAFQTVLEKLSCEVSIRNWNEILQQLMQIEPKRVAIDVPSAASSRLSRFIGPTGAAIVRRTLGRMPPDSGAGGEWPHTMTGPTMPETDFLHMAASLDCREATAGAMQ